jgi:hypothetical protein
MKSFTFIGCSYTVGEGLQHEKLDENNYANIVAKNYNAKAKNLSTSGNSNYKIFISAINELLFNEQEVLFIQWSELSRVWFYPHLDLQFQVPSCISYSDMSYLDLTLTKNFFKTFGEQFSIINHDFNNILNLLNYCKILESIAKNKKNKIVFINGLLPWTKEILDINSCNDPHENFSDYTKNLLSIDQLSDEDVVKFFRQIHDALQETDLNNWVNMFESMLDLQVDVGIDDQHPGSMSHKVYADMIINYLNLYA